MLMWDCYGCVAAQQQVLQSVNQLNPMGQAVPGFGLGLGLTPLQPALHQNIPLNQNLMGQNLGQNLGSSSYIDSYTFSAEANKILK